MNSIPQKFYVYALLDPRTDIVGYIGITTNPRKRYLNHLSFEDKNQQKDSWIQQLYDDDILPAMKIVEIVDTLEQAQEREIYWIQHYLRMGTALHNVRLITKTNASTSCISNRSFLSKGKAIGRNGPKTKRDTFSALGKYISDALLLADMSQAELARRANAHPALVTRIMQGKYIGRDSLLRWCNVLHSPDWLTECILNAAGYASLAQEHLAIAKDSTEEIHQRVLAELNQRRTQESG